MSSLVDLIRRIGIFMIAAQAVIHFAPDRKYEKYMRLIVSVMILLQFIKPVYELFGKAETGWEEQLAGMERALAADGMEEESAAGASSADLFLEQLEKEIKSRLNSSILDENYRVSHVKVRLRRFDGNGSGQYEIEKVRVLVCKGTEPESGQSNGEAVGKIQIGKIEIGAGDGGEEAGAEQQGSGKNGQDGMRDEEKRTNEEGTEELTLRLRERFCIVLGMDEEDLEVSIYGTDEKTD